ncbi:MAG: hypothetical protein GC158_13630 [Cyanobacteria bacterium RI_101]|nr:hypothetical protein [Cyanobacteria bacterium RI_101]
MASIPEGVSDQIEQLKSINLYQKQILDQFATGSMMEEVDDILAELTQINNRILQSQVTIDNLKLETRQMLVELRESIV